MIRPAFSLETKLKAACLASFLLLSWLSTGNLSTYANTTHWNLLLGPCEYLVNIDIFYWVSGFHLLDGMPYESYKDAVDLRRIGYFLLAYPFMKTLGFYYGGIVTNVLLQLISLWVFRRSLKSHFDCAVANFALVALVFNPAMYYWIGSPAPYNTITSFTLLATALLLKYEKTSKTGTQVLIALLLGLLFLGYDIYIYFLPVFALIILVKDRRRLWLLPLTLIPLALWSSILTLWYKAPFGTSNSKVYGYLPEAYYRPIGTFLDWEFWQSYLVKASNVFFEVLPKVFVYSNFFFYPMAFLAILAIAYRGRVDSRLTLFEKSLLFSVISLFLFINMTFAKQRGWDFSGDWLARMYQPVLLVFVLVSARLYSRSRDMGLHGIRKAILGIGLAAVLGNTAIVAGPFFHSPFSSFMFERFYRHGSHDLVQQETVRKHGARPLGFCSDKGKETPYWQEAGGAKWRLMRDSLEKKNVR